MMFWASHRHQSELLRGGGGQVCGRGVVGKEKEELSDRKKLTGWRRWS